MAVRANRMGMIDRLGQEASGKSRVEAVLLLGSFGEVPDLGRAVQVPAAGLASLAAPDDRLGRGTPDPTSYLSA
jgi:hypothetical protein